MKKFLSLFLLISFLSLNNSVCAANNIKIYADRVDGYNFKTVSKHYVPYMLTIVNNDKDTVYFSSKSEVKFENEAGVVHSLVDESAFYKKVRKREVGRYFWIALPCAAIGGFITGASFFILTIPGIGIAVGGSFPYMNAMKYNAKLGQDFYIDNALPLNLEHKQVKNAYVFIPKKENPKKIIITNLYQNKSKPFDVEIPIN